MPEKTEEQLVNGCMEKLRAELPPIWDRVETTRLTGGVVNSRTLANRMSKGDGPTGTYMMGRKRIITREPFLEWLRPQIRPNQQGTV